MTYMARERLARRVRYIMARVATAPRRREEIAGVMWTSKGTGDTGPGANDLLPCLHFLLRTTRGMLKHALRHNALLRTTRWRTPKLRGRYTIHDLPRPTNGGEIIADVSIRRVVFEDVAVLTIRQV